MRKSLLVFSSVLVLFQFASTRPALLNSNTPTEAPFDPNCLHGRNHATVVGNIFECRNGEIGRELMTYARAMLCEYPEKFSRIEIRCELSYTSIHFQGKWTAYVAVISHENIMNGRTCIQMSRMMNCLPKDEYLAFPMSVPVFRTGGVQPVFSQVPFAVTVPVNNPACFTVDPGELTLPRCY